MNKNAIKLDYLQPFRDFLGLFYPNLCLACMETPIKGKEVLCAGCQATLPVTDLHEVADNELLALFYGRIPLQAAAAYLDFKKGTRTQQLVHHLKYARKPEVGQMLGRAYGDLLRYSPAFQEVSLIIPVPLHPKKLQQRGYNQSDMFAMGLSETWGIAWSPRYLIRTTYTETQTKKSRMERFENVEKVFQVNHADKLAGKHVVLVDDVVTTGATIEMCAQVLLQVPDLKISLAAIGWAGR